MSMRKSLILLLLLSFTFTLSAQKTKKGKKRKKEKQENIDKPKLEWKHELGINTSFVIERILNFNDEELAVSPYLLTYNIGLNDWKIRFGIGGERKTAETREEGFADSTSDDQSSIEVRLGYGYQKKFGQKWTATFGADLTGFWSNEKKIQDSGFDKIIDERIQKGFGIGPVLGFQYDFGERLSLYAEGTFYYTFSNTRDGLFFTNFPEVEDLVDNTDGQELLINLPSTLYLVFRF